MFITSKLHKFADISRKRIDDIIGDVSTLTENYIKAIQDQIHKLLTELGKVSLTAGEINNIFQNFTSPFETLNTEALRFTHFKKHGTFIVPENYKLGGVKVIVEKNGEKNQFTKKSLLSSFP